MNIIQARIKGLDEYVWFRYTGKPFQLSFRGKAVGINRHDIFGVRWSSNRKDQRLVFARPDLGLTKVFSITNDDELKSRLERNRASVTVGEVEMNIQPPSGAAPQSSNSPEKTFLVSLGLNPDDFTDPVTSNRGRMAFDFIGDRRQAGKIVVTISRKLGSGYEVHDTDRMVWVIPHRGVIVWDYRLLKMALINVPPMTAPDIFIELANTIGSATGVQPGGIMQVNASEVNIRYSMITYQPKHPEGVIEAREFLAYLIRGYNLKGWAVEIVKPGRNFQNKRLM